MNTFSHLSPFLAVISGSLFSGTALCNDIVLPPPDKKGGKPLMQVLHERHSTRSFADKPIPVEILSSLLWAAQGVNRDDPDYRTAPSSRNSNEIEIYVVLPQGTYLYRPETHRLEKVVQGDMRAATGTQEFAATAPLNLVYVVDQSKQPGDFDARRKLVTACTDAGFIGENCNAPRHLIELRQVSYITCLSASSVQGVCIDSASPLQAASRSPQSTVSSSSLATPSWSILSLASASRCITLARSLAG